MQWSRDLTTGVEAIDDQHKEMIRRINRLLDACQAGKGTNEVGETIAFLEEHIKTHFEAEERIQKENSYPDYEAHKAEHVRFMGEFAGLKDRFVREGPSLTLVVVVNRVVVDWLINHIRRTDMALAEFLRAA